jgi:hypothetical protein
LTLASRYITSLYLDFLHRLPQPDEAVPWVNALAAGKPRDQIALGFTSSLEYRLDQVTAAYRHYLGRDPDATGLADWASALQAGISEDVVNASIMASPEAYARAGGQPGQWVAYVYQNALGRAPEAAGLAAWTMFLQAGGSRTLAAESILASPEAHQREVLLAYPELLGRGGEPAAVVAWTQNLDGGMTRSQLLAELAGSQEYLDGPAGSDLPPLASQQAAVVDAAGANGVHISDGLANDPLLVAQGTGNPYLPIVLTVDGLPEAYARVGSDGNWEVSLPAPLLEGSHLLAAQSVVSTGPVDPGSTFTIGVALTPPRVTVSVTGGANSSTPTLTVSATPNHLAALYGQVQVNVNGEQGQTMAPALGASNSEQITLRPLAAGANQVQVQVGDLAGNVGLSPVITVQTGPAAGSSNGSAADSPTNSPTGTSTNPGSNPALGPTNGPPTSPANDTVTKTFTWPSNQVATPPSGAGISQLGSQGLQDLFMTYMQVQEFGSGGGSAPSAPPTGQTGQGTGQSPPAGGQTPPTTAPPVQAGPTSQFKSTDDLIAFEKQFYVFDAKNNVLVRLRFGSLDSLSQAQSTLKSLGLVDPQVTLQQDLIVGYLPITKLMGLQQVQGLLGVTPVYAAIHNVGAVTTQGDNAMNTAAYRVLAGVDGTGVTVGAISDSVNQVDSHVTQGSGIGVAQSQYTGDLPASGVNILQDGTASDTDEGRGMLEVVHDVAPGAKLAFSSADGGPQAMAQGIVALATQAGAKVIVDDVTFPDEPFFNDGVVAKAVDQVVNQNNVVYVTSAGNFADRAWTDQYRGVTATVGNVSDTFENFDSATGQQQVLQHFSLSQGQTLNLSFQWDTPFLEGGSSDPNFKVKNRLAVLVTDATGTRVLQTFNDNTEATGEALQRVIFTNDGSLGTNDFALAIEMVDGTAPTQLKWVRFDNGAPAEFQGAPTIFGQAAAAGAVTVGAVPYNLPTSPEPFTSQGTATILFDAGGNRFKKPEVRNKPDVAGPDGVFTANFPAVPAGQTLPPGTYPIFTGTSAAAAHIAAAAALLEQKAPTSQGSDLRSALVAAAPHGGAGWDSQTGAGLVQLAPTVQVTPPPFSTLKVGPNVDVSWNVKPNPGTNTSLHQSPGGSAAGAPAGAGGSGPIVNTAPNVDASQRPNSEEEVDIAVDPSNPARLFILSNQDTELGTTSPEGLFGAYSTNGGATWTGRFLADGTDAFKEKACCDPSVAFDTFGNLFITYLNDAGSLAVVGLSTDGGKTFKELTTFTAQDQPKVTTGPGSVWVVFNNGDIEAAGAAVTGLGTVGVFGKVQSVPNSSGGNFGNIAVGPSGQVMVSIQDSGSGQGPQSILIATNPTGLGGSFSSPIPATTSNVGATRDILAQVVGPHSPDAGARVAYDRSPGPHKGRVYLDYLDAADTSTIALNVMVRYSDDNGQTWSAPVQVNDDLNSGASHFFPRLAVDQTNGDVAVSWYDTRNDTGSGPGDTDGKANTDAEIFATVSHTGGVSFLPNVQVAAGPSNANDAPDNLGSQIGFGDYTGLAFYGGVFHPSWADNSNSTGNNPDGRLSGLDAYTAAVTVASLAAFPNPGEDRFEPNDTSERATFFGLLTGRQSYTGLTINRHATGLFDYDWYRWSAATSGTFTATISNIRSNGDLNIRVFTLDSLDTLVELGSSRLLGGATTQTVSVHVTAGEPLLLWVYGYNHSLGFYDMAVDLS